MDVFDAAYRVAHDFPGGAVALARVLGKNPGTFLNEVNPGQDTHKLGVGDAVAATIAARDFRILSAFADSCGHLVFPKPPLSCVSDAALLDLFLKRDTALAAFASVIRQALEDGGISAREFNAIKVAGNEYAATVLEIVTRLEGLRNAG